MSVFGKRDIHPFSERRYINGSNPPIGSISIPMKILRHPGFIEISYPEFFKREPRMDNFCRLFTASQPGTHNLLIDLSGHRGEAQRRDRDDVRRFARALADAFNSMSDNMELIGVLARSDQTTVLQAYVDELERLGYGVRVFTERTHAMNWVGVN